MALKQANQEKVPTANTQIKALMDLVKSLLKAMDEQKETHSALRETVEDQKQTQALLRETMMEQKLAHQNQIEALTKLFAQQIDMLKGEMLAMTEQI